MKNIRLKKLQSGNYSYRGYVLKKFDWIGGKYDRHKWGAYKKDRLHESARTRKILIEKLDYILDIPIPKEFDKYKKEYLKNQMDISRRDYPTKRRKK